MKRREFIWLIGGAAAVPACRPFLAQAQQQKPPTVGLLGMTTPAAQNQWTTAFLNRLRELGWTDGRNIAIEYRWVEGRTERFAELAGELVRAKVDVIVTSGGAVAAAQQATSTIPIVFAVAGDPVGSGLVASLARPGGNVTGLSLQQAELGAKRLELMREVMPGLRTVAIIFNAGYSSSVREKTEVEDAARKLGLETVALGVRSSQDIVPVFDALGDRAKALYVVSEPLISANRLRINTLALGAKLPTMHGFREYVEFGGLMSYGPSLTDLWRRTGDYVDKLLRGAKASDIPVEQPTKFDLVLNQTVAKALGLTLPSALLTRADEVIE
jgi:putative ABC transport system substrate-binding protein